MMTISEAKNLRLSETEKLAMAHRIAQRLAEEEATPRTWGRVMRSKPFKVGVSFTVAAAMILSVALPVTLSSHADLNGPISGGGVSPNFGEGGDVPLDSAWRFLYYAEHSNWPRGDIPLRVSCLYDDEVFLRYIAVQLSIQNGGLENAKNWTLDEISEKIRDIKLYFFILQTFDRNTLFDFFFSNGDYEVTNDDFSAVLDIAKGNVKVGEVSENVYVYHELAAANQAELRTRFVDYDDIDGRFPDWVTVDTVDCVIPESLLSGEGGYLVFDLIGAITFDEGVLYDIGCNFFCGARGCMQYTVTDGGIQLSTVEQPDWGCVPAE